MSNGYQITQEELDYEWDVVDRPRLECMDEQELLDDWLPLMEEVVGILKKPIASRFKSLKVAILQENPF